MFLSALLIKTDESVKSWVNVILAHNIIRNWWWSYEKGKVAKSELKMTNIQTETLKALKRR